ncbi:unnamed protein product [Calicophoron daubneyi]|uniref:Small ribosomal subunit protein uS5m n=1 Tax=Calicophoron daubneyi TaxID=300641 RepID=A0AAV2T8I7_CALDB
MASLVRNARLFGGPLLSRLTQWNSLMLCIKNSFGTLPNAPIHLLPSSSVIRMNSPDHQGPLVISVRPSTIFTSVPLERLWEGVTGPKGSTKKRARGKRRVTRPRIDLHRGQRIGMGRGAMEWPGLNAPLLMENQIRSIKKGEFDETYFKRLEELRNKSAVKRKRLKLPPILRGWTGSRLEGQSVGPPTPDHLDFDTKVIEMKVVATMTATVGRYRRFSVLVATGNGRGLCGIGKAKSITLGAAVRRAKARAAQHVISFNLKDDRTLWHTGYVHEWHSKIFARPAKEGAGLICHRLIRTLCQLIGIKDMYAKVEGHTKNYQVIARGFLRLLNEQKTYSDLADLIGLHVVEFSMDRDMCPRILASPSPGNSTDPSKLNLLSSGSSSPVSETPVKKDEKLPILAISHPDRHRARKPWHDEHESFLDDLTEVGEEETTASHALDLVASGERDLDTLVLGGRIPLIRGKPTPFYWNNPGNLKKAAVRHRFRNHEAARREREVYAALDEINK